MEGLIREREKHILQLKAEKHFKSADWTTVRKLLPSYEKIIKMKSWDDVDEKVLNDNFFNEDSEIDLEGRQNSLLRSSRSNNIIIVEIRRRLLMAIKSSYLRQYEEGLIGRSASSFLVRAIERALDFDDVAVHWEIIQLKLSFPSWLKKLFLRYPQTSFVQLLISKQIFSSIEIIAAFLKASENTDVAFHYRSSKDDTIGHSLKLELEQYVLQATQIWHDLQIDFPEQFVQVETKQVLGHILHHEKHRVLVLYRVNGILEENEAEKMTNELDEKIYSLKALQQHKEISPAVLQFLESSIFCGISEAEIFFLFQRSGKREFQPEELLFRRGESATGIFIVTKGIVDLFLCEEILIQSVPSGSVIESWSYMAEELYFYTAEAKTCVEVFFLSRADLRKFFGKFNNNTLLFNMWKHSAIDIAQSFFFRHFSSTIDVTTLVSRSGIVRLHHFSTSERFSNGGFLLKGTLQLSEEFLGSEFNQEDMKNFENAPILILPSQRQLSFSEGSIILKFPESNWFDSSIHHEKSNMFYICRNVSDVSLSKCFCESANRMRIETLKDYFHRSSDIHHHQLDQVVESEKESAWKSLILLEGG